MDWLTQEPPEAELPDDFKDPIYIPKVAVVVGSEANPEKVEIPIGDIHPQKLLKVHAIDRKHPIVKRKVAQKVAKKRTRK